MRDAALQSLPQQLSGMTLEGPTVLLPPPSHAQAPQRHPEQQLQQQQQPHLEILMSQFSLSSAATAAPAAVQRQQVATAAQTLGALSLAPHPAKSHNDQQQDAQWPHVPLVQGAQPPILTVRRYLL